MHFDPAKERLHLASGLVQSTDAQGILGGLISLQHDRLIANHPSGSIRGERIATLRVHVALRPGHKEHKETSRLIRPVPALEVDLAAIHDVESTDFGNQLIEDAHVVQLDVADGDKAGDIAAQIEQSVHLHCGFGGAERCPRKQQERQVDRGRAQGVCRVVQVHARGLVDIQLAGDTDQALREVGIDPPVPRPVRQRIARDQAADTHVVELLGPRARTRFDVSQALAKRQLCKRYAQKLILTGELWILWLLR